MENSWAMISHDFLGLKSAESTSQLDHENAQITEENRWGSIEKAFRGQPLSKTHVKLMGHDF